jgi:hypothetical protein
MNKLFTSVTANWTLLMGILARVHGRYTVPMGINGCISNTKQKLGYYVGNQRAAKGHIVCIGLYNVISQIATC